MPPILEELFDMSEKHGRQGLNGIPGEKGERGLPGTPGEFYIIKLTYNYLIKILSN